MGSPFQINLTVTPIFRERAEVLVGIGNPAEETIFFTASCPQISKQNTKHQFVNGSIRSKDSSFKIWDHIEAPSAPNSDKNWKKKSGKFLGDVDQLGLRSDPRPQRRKILRCRNVGLELTILIYLHRNSEKTHDFGSVYYPMFMVSKRVPKSHPNDFSAMATKSPGKPLRLEAGGNLWFRAVLVWTLQETHCWFFFPMVSATYFFTRKRWCEKKTCQAELLANNTHVLHKVQMAVWWPQVFVAASCWWRPGRRAIWKRWMSYVLWNQVFWTPMFCTYIGAHGTSLYVH